MGTQTDRILLGITHKPYSLKKSWARAVWNNNLMLTVAWIASQAQAYLGPWLGCQATHRQMVEVLRVRVMGKAKRAPK